MLQRFHYLPPANDLIVRKNIINDPVPIHIFVIKHDHFIFFGFGKSFYALFYHIIRFRSNDIEHFHDSLPSKRNNNVNLFDLDQHFFYSYRLEAVLIDIHLIV